MFRLKPIKVTFEHARKMHQACYECWWERAQNWLMDPSPRNQEVVDSAYAMYNYWYEKLAELSHPGFVMPERFSQDSKFIPNPYLVYSGEY